MKHAALLALLPLALVVDRDDRLPTNAATAPQDEALRARMDAAADRALGSGETEALVVLVALGDEVLLAKGWGSVAGEDVDDETSFRVGAWGELLVTAAVLEHVQAGRFGLETPLHELLPRDGFPEDGPTLRQILAHSSGLPSYVDLLAARRAKVFPDDDVVAFLREQPAEFEPGTCFEPNASNAFVLGRILETFTSIETPVERYLQHRFFEPYGLDDSRHCEDGPPLDRRAPSGREGGGALELDEAVPVPHGADQLCSSARDVLRFHRKLLDRELLDDEHLDALRTPFSLADGALAPRGLGFDVTPLGGREGYGYGGSTAGQRFHLAWYPEADLTIVTLADGVEAPCVEVERATARAFFDMPEPEVADLPTTPEQRAGCTGVYMVGCMRYELLEVDEHLVLVRPETDGATLLWQGGTLYRARDDAGLSLRFDVDDRGALGFVLEEHGAQVYAKKVD